jgi:hypothetical protein
MNPQLSSQPTWFEPTPKLRALNGKPVRIQKVDCEWDMTLAVDDEADPRSVNAGECSVRVFDSVFDDMNAEWTNAGGATPTSQTHYHQKFLNEDAVKLLHENPDDPEFGELILDFR